MALEARHHNHFSPQIITNNREFGKIDEAKLNNPVQMASANPFATTMENPWMGMNHQFMGMNNMVIQPETNFVKVENEVPVILPNDPRKRSRDSMENQFDNLNIPPMITDDVPPGFAPQTNFLQDEYHQWDIDYILSQFTKNIKVELETQTERDLKFLLASLTSKFIKKMKIQSEKISRIARLNMALQERAKALCAETQLYKDIARHAELTNMSLRRDFDRILAKVSKHNRPMPNEAAEQDAESCYGSTDFGNNDQGVDQDVTTRIPEICNRMCKKCGERESSVLLLPCRHLCLCGVCGSSVQANCPVCDTGMTATVHVCLT
ncbi:hypothetical protein ACET3Z_004093 [Daucus carota]